MHRQETVGRHADEADRARELPPDVAAEGVLGPERGYGPLFHRKYRTRIRNATIAPQTLMALVQSDPNIAAPTAFARFQKVTGAKGTMQVGDEFVVRMPGPWDGPVRVISARPLSFRLATLEGHLECGQIEFRVAERDGLEFEIESWARSSSAFANLLYHHMRMAKEVQLHMWLSFLERVVALSGGRMTGGVDIETRRVEELSDAR